MIPLQQEYYSSVNRVMTEIPSHFLLYSTRFHIVEVVIQHMIHKMLCHKEYCFSDRTHKRFDIDVLDAQVILNIQNPILLLCKQANALATQDQYLLRMACLPCPQNVFFWSIAIISNQVDMLWIIAVYISSHWTIVLGSHLYWQWIHS